MRQDLPLVIRPGVRWVTVVLQHSDGTWTAASGHEVRASLVEGGLILVRVYLQAQEESGSGSKPRETCCLAAAFLAREGIAYLADGDGEPTAHDLRELIGTAETQWSCGLAGPQAPRLIRLTDGAAPAEDGRGAVRKQTWREVFGAWLPDSLRKL